MSNDLFPNPVSIVNAKKSFYVQPGGVNVPGGYLSGTFIGSGHTGADVMTRIIMSLRSSIDEEVEWALSYLAQLSCSDPHLIVFEKSPFLGHELIKHFVRPFQLLVEGKDISKEMMQWSLDSVLSLRNAAQDLINQQWLSEVHNLRKSLVEVLRFFIGWFYKDASQNFSLPSYNDLFTESLNYSIDLLEPLSCYYVDNTRNDPLFNQLLQLSSLTNDRNLLLGSIKCLTHLLIVKDKSSSENDSQSRSQEEDLVDVAPNNCIESIQESHLERFVNFLLLNDTDLVLSVLELIKQYLTSKALHPQYPKSIPNSQIYRLQKLLQLKTTKANYQVLVKQLPIFLVSYLPLNDPSRLPSIQPSTLSNRNQFVGVPASLPELPKHLYDIIVKFPEPLRATTWLRCCYEPHAPSNTKSADSDVTPGEVTQISLWKSYEKQFEEVWQTSKTQPNPEWPPLLPAVEFIKNVNNAFPNSEAMVLTVEQEGTDSQQPKKKFIIKGIQPRQTAVNIDVANYEALKQVPGQPESDEQKDLEIGHVDGEKLNHSIKYLTDYISEGNIITSSSPEFNDIHRISRDVLDSIVTDVLETSADSEGLSSVFRLYNSYWLPELVYANPSLLEEGIVSNKWLKYLL